MPEVMQPLRDEHRELMPHLETLRAAAEAVGNFSLDRQQALVREAHEFLSHHLVPHAVAEEAALYPAVERVMAAPGATATMSRDHTEVVRLVEELGMLSTRLEAGESDFVVESSLRRVLYGLHAIVSLHFAKEESVYLPLLDERLSEEDAAEMFETMERAAAEARAAAG